jgi:hypothetical protein
MSKRAHESAFSLDALGAPGGMVLTGRSGADALRPQVCSQLKLIQNRSRAYATAGAAIHFIFSKCAVHPGTMAC